MISGIEHALSAHAVQPPWRRLDDTQRQHLDAQLRRELRPGHPLYGGSLTPVLRRIDCDDILVLLRGSPPSLALVHLTWSDNSADATQWPRFVAFASFPELLDRVLNPSYVAHKDEAEAG